MESIKETKYSVVYPVYIRKVNSLVVFILLVVFINYQCFNDYFWGQVQFSSVFLLRLYILYYGSRNFKVVPVPKQFESERTT